MIEIPKIRIITETAEQAAQRMFDDPAATPEQIFYRERTARVIAAMSLGFPLNRDEFYGKMREAIVTGTINAANRGEFLLFAKRTLQIGSRQFPLPPRIIGSLFAYFRGIL